MPAEKLRILILVDRWSSGGVPVVISSHCRVLLNAGHQVKVVTYYPSEFPEIEGVDFISLNATRRGDISVLRKIRKLLTGWNPDIIHDHFGGLWSATYLYKKRWRNKAILHYHNEFVAVEDSPDESRKVRDQLFLKFLLPRYRKILTVSGHNKTRLEDHARVRKSQTEVFYNSINRAHFMRSRSLGENVREKHDIPEDALFLGSIGRMVYEKGFDTVCDVLIELHRKGVKAYGLIAGDGDASIRKKIIEKAEKADISQFLIITAKEPNTADYLSALDVFLMCSRQEPFGLTILEAMVCDTPVLGIVPEGGGGPTEIIINDENGFLIGHRNPTELAQYVLKVYQDKEYAKKQIEGGKATIAKFSEEAMGEKLLTLYAKIYSET